VGLLIAASAFAQEEDEVCPNLKGDRLAPGALRRALQAHEEWFLRGGWLVGPTVPGKAIFCNLDLSGAKLAGAVLGWADLAGADLSDADLRGAILFEADLRGADLRLANLSEVELSRADLTDADLLYAVLDGADLTDADVTGANLRGAELRGADLHGTDLTGAKLSYAALAGAEYAPVTAPAKGHLAGLRGLDTVHFPPGESSGLVQLRAQLAEVGLRDLERQATYAIERQTTEHKLAEWDAHPLLALEGAFRLVFFEWTTAYGLYPGRALLLLLALIGLFAPVYLIPLRSWSGRGGIYRVWPERRLEGMGHRAELMKEAKVERLRPWGPGVAGYALWFSLLSAFHIGWRELNVGNWLARLQAREYLLHPTGWVRVVAGVQSLLSVYLLAIWALTYFGRPFQ
jgi:Pentapeptide repeats (8 copies)